MRSTRIPGYSGITAGYLILGVRPCLVGRYLHFRPVVRDALTSLGVGPGDLAPTWYPCTL